MPPDQGRAPGIQRVSSTWLCPLGILCGGGGEYPYPSSVDELQPRSWALYCTSRDEGCGSVCHRPHIVGVMPEGSGPHPLALRAAQPHRQQLELIYRPLRCANNHTIFCLKKKTSRYQGVRTCCREPPRPQRLCSLLRPQPDALLKETVAQPQLALRFLLLNGEQLQHFELEL